ncbi:MAG: hypothetical protein WAJ93_12655, partial [Candidatus Nitrosopolaris sp.]
FLAACSPSGLTLSIVRIREYKLITHTDVGLVNDTFTTIQPINIKELSQPGQMCLSHVNINSAKKF